jgi:hypothetical protein
VAIRVPYRGRAREQLGGTDSRVFFCRSAESLALQCRRTLNNLALQWTEGEPFRRAEAYNAGVKFLSAVALSLACAAVTFAQQPDVDSYIRDHQAAIVREFMELVAIPNVRSDLPNIRRNAELLRRMLERRGMKPEVWDTPSTPLVYGERLVAGATRTILFYIHFDGQAVDKAGWKQPDPWQPVVRAGALEDGAEEIRDSSSRTTFPDAWRIYARSAGDDKGPIQAFVSAMDAIGGNVLQNVKVILHGEEEGGGPALDSVVRTTPTSCARTCC